MHNTPIRSSCYPHILAVVFMQLLFGVSVAAISLFTRDH